MQEKNNYLVNVEVPISPFHFEYRLKGVHYVHIVRETLRLMREEKSIHKRPISPFSIKVTALGALGIAKPVEKASDTTKPEKVDLKKAQELVDKTAKVIAYPKNGKK